MKVVGRSVLDAFCKKHTDAKTWIEIWLAEAEEATWSTPQAIKERYSSVSFLVGNLIIFNVKGNEYRMEVMAAHKTGLLIVKWAGTHREYDARNRHR